MSSASPCTCTCPDGSGGGDSALSTTANVAGILTFAYALGAGVLAYLYLLRSFSRSDDSIARFYDAFAACALESDLVRRDILASSSARAVVGEQLDDNPKPKPQLQPQTNGGGGGNGNGNGSGNGSTTITTARGGGVVADGLGAAASSIPLLPAGALAVASPRTTTASAAASATTSAAAWQPNQHDANRASAPQPHPTRSYEPPAPPPPPPARESPYLLDPDSLARLYSHVRAVEIELQRSAAKAVAQNAEDDLQLRRRGGDVGTYYASYYWRRLLGMGRWVNRESVLRAGLEKREALTPRLLVVQMSLAGSRLRALAEGLVEIRGRVVALEGGREEGGGNGVDDERPIDGWMDRRMDE